jgi:hypothetical protein
MTTSAQNDEPSFRELIPIDPSSRPYRQAQNRFAAQRDIMTEMMMNPVIHTIPQAPSLLSGQPSAFHPCGHPERPQRGDA